MIARDLQVIVDTVDGFPPNFKRFTCISSNPKNEGVVSAEDTTYGLSIPKRDGHMFSEGWHSARFRVKMVIHPSSCSNVKFLFMLPFSRHQNLPSFSRVDDTLIQSDGRVDVNIIIMIVHTTWVCRARTYVQKRH